MFKLLFIGAAVSRQPLGQQQGDEGVDGVRSGKVLTYYVGRMRRLPNRPICSSIV